jgi:hypothetical protein
MATTTEMLALLARSHEETRRLVAGLSAAEREECGAADHWAAKDIIAHAAEWERRLAVGLAAARRGEKPAAYPEFDRVNAEIFADYCDRPWDEVLAAATAANQALADEAQLLSADDLNDPQRNPYVEGHPLWRRIVGNAFIHVVSHYAQYYIEQGEQARADCLQDEAAGLLCVLDDSPTWRALVLYNLACHFALSGDRPRALAGLQEALLLNPGLAEWAQQDTDLDLLRDTEEYGALFDGRA